MFSLGITMLDVFGLKVVQTLVLYAKEIRGLTLA